MTERPTADRPVRILQVLGSSAGGVARHVGQVSAALTGSATAHSTGVEVLVAGPESVRSLVVTAPQVGFVPVEIADRPRPGDVGAVRALRGLAAGSDVLHAHGLRAGALAVLAARSLPPRRRPRTIVTLHNLPVGSRAVRTVSAVLEVIVGRGADEVLGVSGDLVDLARRRGARHAQRALVPAPGAASSGSVGLGAAGLGAASPGTAGLGAPSSGSVGADTRAVRAGLGLAADERLLVTVGRLAPQKGLDTLCETASGLAASGLRFVWVVAGDGPLAQTLRADIDRRDVPVHLLGARTDVMDLMAAADVVVSTAVWEGQPIAIQEALRVGAAVVATDAGGTREVTGDAAVLVPVGDARGLATEIAALLADPEELGRRQDAARRRAGQLPTIGDVVSSLSHIYRLTSDPDPRAFG